MGRHTLNFKTWTSRKNRVPNEEKWPCLCQCSMKCLVVFSTMVKDIGISIVVMDAAERERKGC